MSSSKTVEEQRAALRLKKEERELERKRQEEEERQLEEELARQEEEEKRRKAELVAEEARRKAELVAEEVRARQYAEAQRRSQLVVDTAVPGESAFSIQKSSLIYLYQVVMVRHLRYPRRVVTGGKARVAPLLENPGRRPRQGVRR